MMMMMMMIMSIVLNHGIVTLLFSFIMFFLSGVNLLSINYLMIFPVVICIKYQIRMPTRVSLLYTELYIFFVLKNYGTQSLLPFSKTKSSRPTHWAFYLPEVIIVR